MLVGMSAVCCNLPYNKGFYFHGKLRKKNFPDSTWEYMDLKSIEMSGNGLQYIKYTNSELNSKKKRMTIN